MLSLAGVATTVPLLLFASAARRVTLTTMGMLQFLTPLMQFVTGVFFLGEEMPPERLAGFALVWVACTLLMIDLIRVSLRGRRDARTLGISASSPDLD